MNVIDGETNKSMLMPSCGSLFHSVSAWILFLLVVSPFDRVSFFQLLKGGMPEKAGQTTFFFFFLSNIT